MKILRVNLPGREYDIKIEKGLLSKCGEHLLEVASCCKVAVITDSNVAPLYSDKTLSSLKSCGFDATLITVAPGEGSKSIETLSGLYDRILDSGLTRSDLIVALGGGVVGDLAGFCASTLFRGIPFVQIPTTLLAQVDSSVGGKVAVNLSRGKNLIGNFYQPKLVLIDPDCLDTLTDKIFSDGMAEVVKYGAILDEELFSTIESSPTRSELMKIIEELIFRSCELKKNIVETDECDTGRRMILNFGHTFGHAIEKHYNFSGYTHGEGVAAGMVMAAEFGEYTGISKLGTSKRISSLVKALGLPERVSIDKSAFLDAVKMDKKGEGDLVSLVLLETIGCSILRKTKKEALWIW